MSISNYHFTLRCNCCVWEIFYKYKCKEKREFFCENKFNAIYKSILHGYRSLYIFNQTASILFRNEIKFRGNSVFKKERNLLQISTWRRNRILLWK